MVFQNYALYPHMTVEQNLGFGLKLRKTPKAEIAAPRRARPRRILGLERLLERKPAALSGGQRQRVAMGRAMVREPQAFLMDEPLSNLDAKLRVQMRAELARLRDRLADHDRLRHPRPGRGDDARRPRRRACATACCSRSTRRRTCTDNPANLFVAAFIGSPSMNLVEAEIGDGRVRFGGFDLPAPAGRGLARYEGGTLILGIRPSDFEDASLRP